MTFLPLDLRTAAFPVLFRPGTTRTLSFDFGTVDIDQADFTATLGETELEIGGTGNILTVTISAEASAGPTGPRAFVVIWNDEPCIADEWIASDSAATDVGDGPFPIVVNDIAVAVTVIASPADVTAGGDMLGENNLSEITDPAAARANIGALGAAAAIGQALIDAATAAEARTALELGTAALAPAGSFDAIGAAGVAQTNAQAYTDALVDQLITGAPGTLNTLAEIAAALNDDPAVVSGLMTTLAGKAPNAGVDYLVGTATTDLTGEIVVGTTPGGELGGTWADPTVDATHSGSSHAAVQAAAEATAAGALTGHTGDATAAHAASAVSADSTTLTGTATDVQGVLEELDDAIVAAAGGAPAAHAASHGDGGADEITISATQISDVLADGQLPAGVTRDTELTAAIAAAIADVIATAPGTLDTLDELAAALGDDPNLAATLAASIATKVAKADYDAHSILAATTDDTPAALTVAEATLVGRATGGNIAALTASQARTLLALGTMALEAATDYVPKSLADANSVLYAVTDNTPAALAVPASRIVGRKATGDIGALTGPEVGALLTAADIPIVDAGSLLAATDTEGALAELAAGTPLASLPGYHSLVASNPGASAFGATTTYTTIWNGTLYSIPADSLTVGDVFLLTAWGSYLNNSGAVSDFGIEPLLAGAAMVAFSTSTAGTQVAASATARSWSLETRIRILSLGSPFGVFSQRSRFWLSNTSTGTNSPLIGTAASTGQQFGNEFAGGGIIDTAAAQSLDVKAKTFTATATQTVTPAGITVEKFNAP